MENFAKKYGTYINILAKKVANQCKFCMIAKIAIVVVLTSFSRRYTSQRGDRHFEHLPAIYIITL